MAMITAPYELIEIFSLPESSAISLHDVTKLDITIGKRIEDKMELWIFKVGEIHG